MCPQYLTVTIFTSSLDVLRRNFVWSPSIEKTTHYTWINSTWGWLKRFLAIYSRRLLCCTLMYDFPSVKITTRQLVTVSKVLIVRTNRGLNFRRLTSILFMYTGVQLQFWVWKLYFISIYKMSLICTLSNNYINKCSWHENYFSAVHIKIWHSAAEQEKQLLK